MIIGRDFHTRYPRIGILDKATEELTPTRRYLTPGSTAASCVTFSASSIHGRHSIMSITAITLIATRVRKELRGEFNRNRIRRMQGPSQF